LLGDRELNDKWDAIGCAVTGGHYDPWGVENHALPSEQESGATGAETRHIGCNGNLYSDGPNCASEYVFCDTQMAVVGPDGVLGRGTTIHRNPDQGVAA